MAVYGNFSDYSVGKWNYSNDTRWSMGKYHAIDNVKQKEGERPDKPENAVEKEGGAERRNAAGAGNAFLMTTEKRPESMAAYVKKLSKLAPSVEFRVGNTLPLTRSGKTLTINPGILRKMRNNPEQEKETKELIKGVEFITKFMDGIYKASGRTVVYRHGYIDENGKYYSCSYIKKEDSLSPKLRAERRKNSDLLIRRTREKTAKRKKELQAMCKKKKQPKAGVHVDLRL